MSIKLVKFPDGTYGIRKGVIFYKYLDMFCSSFWWKNDSVYFDDCKTTYEKAKKCFDTLSKPDEVIE